MSEIRTLTAYFAERERRNGRFLAEALLDLYEDRRMATSVMLRGIAGFGPANLIRSDRSLSLSEDPPVAVAAVDTADRIGSVAGDVAELVGRGVITLERSDIPPATPRGGAESVTLAFHVGRRHRVGGVPGYVAVCDVLHRRGFAGADVYLGVDGTVDGARRRARFFSRNADVPLSIVGTGTGSQAAAAIDELRTMMPQAWITTRPVSVCKSDGASLLHPTSAPGPFQKLVVHTAESSLHRGRPIHRALVRLLKDSGQATGATVLRGLWGFHGAERPGGDRVLQLVRHVPVTTVVVDTASNIAAIYPTVDEVTEAGGLVTVESLPGMLEVHDGRRLGTLDLGH